MFTILNISREGEYSQWLEFRRKCLTSTDAAKIISKNFTATVFLDSKSKPYSGFMNKYMEFGNMREPEIIKQMSEKFQIEPNDNILQHGLFPNFTATPDGMGERFTVEVKTSIHGLEYNIKKYYAQIQWQMFVTGKTYSLFIVEQHKDFVPQEIFYTFVQYDSFIETIFVERGTQIVSLLKKYSNSIGKDNKKAESRDDVFAEKPLTGCEKQSSVEEDNVKW